MSKNPKKGKPGRAQLPIVRAMISAGWGLLLDLVLLLLFSVFFYLKDLPAEMNRPVATVILMLGGLLGGYLCGKALRRQGLLHGVLVGGVQFMVLLLVSLSCSGSEVMALALYKCLMLLVSGAVGCILGVNRKSHAARAALRKS